MVKEIETYMNLTYYLYYLKNNTMKKLVRRFFGKDRVKTNLFYDLKDKYEDDFSIEYYTHTNNNISYIHYWFKGKVYDFKILGNKEYIGEREFNRRINRFYSNFELAIKTGKFDFDSYENVVYFDFEIHN